MITISSIYEVMLKVYESCTGRSLGENFIINDKDLLYLIFLNGYAIFHFYFFLARDMQ